MRTINPAKPAKLTRQSGQVFLIVAISLVVLMGAIGLAIDTALAYMTKAKLNAAIDSSVVAAARAVTQGATQAEQIASGTQAAREFFNANYPTGYLGTTVNFTDPTFVFNGGQVTIDGNASAAVPVTFMHVMNFQFMHVAASAQTIRKDLDLAFVMDTSGSMSSVAATVRTNAKLFLTKFNPLLDRVALIHFSYGAFLDDAIRPVQRGFDIATMNSQISKLNFAGLTNSPEGMWNARNQLNSIALANRSSLRVIVFFSDGSPNTIASVFKFKTPADCLTAGSLITGDGTGTGTPEGLWKYDQQNQLAAGKCNPGNQIVKNLDPAALPNFYNAHSLTDTEFPIITNSPRVVTNDTSTNAKTWTNINRASRNLLEAMATKSRAEGIFVFTLGLGTELINANGPPPSDKGEDILKCMANTGDALPRCVTAGAGQPVGIYCHAVDENALAPCFDKLASAILRITK
ncbi:VWA domain-containing protein [Glaciimonas sp. PCH181]|uniref:VWA domain-containing protein n=1 Tax=Glaciimonas sp. PCH181 TaxID=2133943 RepID=UPI000D35D855|nr:VWA domain-containing protein [Glaciimonas sp. PCH181]PUA17742.1 VWA domain-containing protein [Glaciimonas sp. PCH181]